MLINAHRRSSKAFYELNKILCRVWAAVFMFFSLINLVVSRDKSIFERLEFSAVFLLGAFFWWVAATACASLAAERQDKKITERAVGQQVQIVRTNPGNGQEVTETATVLSANEGLILKIGDRRRDASRKKG